MQKTIALVAHDNRKPDLLEWVRRNVAALAEHRLVCTGTTGRKVQDALRETLGEDALPEITLLKSGPLGGDQQLGALISESKIDVLVFLWDPMQPQPHDVDVVGVGHAGLALLGVVRHGNHPCSCASASCATTRRSTSCLMDLAP